MVVREVKTVSVVDAVVDDLRDRILAGDCRPGAAITEAVIAGQYDISRPTARAGIERLTAEGLLERGSHRSARVPQLTSADVHDIYETRLRIESEAVRALAAKSTVPPLAVETNRHVREAVHGSASSVASVRPDLHFHTSLVDGLESPRTSRLYRSIVGEVLLCMSQVQSRSLLTVEQIADEHQEIIEYIRAGDSEAGLACLRDHLRRASQRLAAQIEASVADGDRREQ